MQGLFHTPPLQGGQGGSVQRPEHSTGSAPTPPPRGAAPPLHRGAVRGAFSAFGGRTGVRFFLTAPPSWGGWGGSACAPPNPPLNLPPGWGETFRVALRTGRDSPPKTAPLCRGASPRSGLGGRRGVTSTRRTSAPTPPPRGAAAPCVGGLSGEELFESPTPPPKRSTMATAGCRQGCQSRDCSPVRLLGPRRLRCGAACIAVGSGAERFPGETPGGQPQLLFLRMPDARCGSGR